MPDNLPCPVTLLDRLVLLDPAADRAPEGRGGIELGYSSVSPAQALEQAVARFAANHPGAAHKVLRSGVLPVTPTEVGQYFAEVAPA